jgi:hypothetical protein
LLYLEYRHHQIAIGIALIDIRRLGLFARDEKKE